MSSDTIADFLTRIRNASRAKHTSLVVPYSKVKYRIAKILVNNGYLVSATQIQSKPYDLIELELPQISDRVLSLKRVSKPGRRIYVNAGEIPVVLGGQGIAIVSTSRGMMTGYEAYSKGIGGELICEVW
ncbi:30S ribosomal protein S8 [Candidatus Saccharibacteria bacterium]|nr:30S ribosomal protein S8 [Candidatus Saccharibacteria bacterium]